MNTTFEKLSSNQVKLHFTIDAAQWNVAVDKAYHKMVKKINLPGFRKGKAPKMLIEKQYGKEIFYDDAINVLFPEVYPAAVKENDITPVDSPELTDANVTEDGGYEFTLTVFVKPDVTLGEYKGVAATRDVAEITEDDVSAEIERARERVSRFEEVTDRAAKLDDRVNIDYAGTQDGVAFEGGTAEKQDLVLGSGSFIPGFEEQVVGMNIGEEKDINVTFPEQYHAEELAGKPAVFHVKLNGIQVKELPALDDTFAQDVSECDTLEQYRNETRERLIKNAEDSADARFENEIMQSITEGSQVDIPNAMIEDEITEQIRDMEMRMAYQGLRMEDYLKYMGQTMEDLRGQMKNDCEARVKMRLVLEAIIKTEKIEPTEEEIEAEITEYAKNSGRTDEDFRKNLSEQGKEYMKDIATTKKAIKFLKDNAKIVESTEEDDSEVVVDAE